MTLKIDLSEEDGKPHWLSREGNPRPTKDQIRKKHRDRWLVVLGAARARARLAQTMARWSRV